MQIARRHVDAEARIIRPDDAGYARLLAVMNVVNRDRYDLYRAKTRRPIPLVVLSATEVSATEEGADPGDVNASWRAGARRRSW